MKKLSVFLGLSLSIIVSCGLYWLTPRQTTDLSTGNDETTSDAASLNSHESYLTITPLPISVSLNSDKVRLGEKLFHDANLSGDGSISCASCHDLKQAGTVRAAKGDGSLGTMGKRNVPTVFNSGYNFVQFWDGRAETLEAQMEIPLLNPEEMNSNWPDLLAKLHRDPEYLASFTAIYAEGVSKQSVENAIANYQRSLITPNSRFDRFLRGNSDALSAVEKEGYQLFSSLGCIACHQGINIGGNLFQKIGIFKEYVSDDSEKEIDYGRYHITGVATDKYVFKVPSLRNVAKTAPYFHDGSVPTLEAAVLKMGEYQLGRQLASDEISKVSAFLHSLTGEYKSVPL